MNQQTHHAAANSGSRMIRTSKTRHDPTASDARTGIPVSEAPVSGAPVSEVTLSGSPAPASRPHGLTAQQETAAAMLASGSGVNEVADTLHIHRSTVWAWKNLPTFIAYTNSLVQEIKDHTRAGVLSLYSDAIETFRRVLQSDNGVAALKAATYIIERVKGLEVGTTDAREIVRQMCTTHQPHELETMWNPTEQFDEASYRRICAELGIEEETGAGKANHSRSKHSGR